MARPEDHERARKHMAMIENNKHPAQVIEPPSEPVLIKRKRDLQEIRRNAITGLEQGDWQPLATYRSELSLYSAFLGLGGHKVQRDYAQMMLSAVSVQNKDVLLKVLERPRTGD